jgi:hypothetical protein
MKKTEDGGEGYDYSRESGASEGIYGRGLVGFVGFCGFPFLSYQRDAIFYRRPGQAKPRANLTIGIGDRG